MAALVVCVAHGGHQFLARHGLDHAFGAVVDWSIDLRAERLVRAEIRVQARPVPSELEGGFQAALEHCLVHDSPRSAPDVVIGVSAPSHGGARGA